ncbi:hypothetical protein JDS99_27960 [Bacillus cereus group sp. N6]|uniref:hypothetical protein n=1 Tax=Bacillus cereus group sp. N6 TaxID=2794583 RepID=UPI0018F32944|nr:hypothetical protein [Bacillus cereus group sp. N6]MBJ8113400.1 hypothetical protein [Bacillus cereus group sp. N6]
MRSEKDLLKQWKADLQAIQEEKGLKKKAKIKNKRYSIPGNTGLTIHAHQLKTFYYPQVQKNVILS